MRRLLVKTLFSPLSTAVLTFILLLGGFYFFILKPKLELPAKLNAAEEIIATNHFNLVQNRLSLLGLAKLDVSSPNIGSDKLILIENALKTNELGLENLEKPPIIGAIERNTNINLNELFDLNKSILEKQQAILQDLKNLSTMNKNLFLYNPLADLGVLDLQTESGRDAIINRSHSAIEGLENINKDLESIGNSETVQSLIQKISATQELLREQITLVQEGNNEEASLVFYEITNNFNDLKQTALKLETDILQNTSSVELLTEQTNLMLKYEFLLEKINELQNSIDSVVE